jgi:iron complex transport system ATP-binding protein
MTSPVLRVRNVGWRVGTVPVLEHVSFDVAPGEFVAVMGRNGAGKSTLLDIVAGLRTPTEGDVMLADRAIDEMTALGRARTLAHLPQSLRADLSMRVEALVLMGRYVHADRWFESDEDRRIAEEAMQRCECLQFRRRILATLSGGERQRVFLAACLAQRAPVLLLDEPATFLDVDQQLQCFNVLRAEADRGTACVAVTHDVNLALTFCTRLIVLAERRVARDLPTETALDDPAWLQAFSARLTVEQGGVRPWVRYQ